MKSLGDSEKATDHRKWHLRYKPDDNAKGRAVRLAREKYPAANHAAEAVVIYPLQRATGSKEPHESQEKTAGLQEETEATDVQ